MPPDRGIAMVVRTKKEKRKTGTTWPRAEKEKKKQAEYRAFSAQAGPRIAP